RQLRHTSESLSEEGKCSGIMGVPITFLEKWNPDQFEIIWLDGPDDTRWYGQGPAVGGKNKYRRVFIKRKM
ncbi:hypothetical protein IIZ81_01365, partial [Candidatus Saccharibacteria bacterium]|nr:hypothetical protein [Candidatus Saccharibacteria bacterium]